MTYEEALEFTKRFDDRYVDIFDQRYYFPKDRMVDETHKAILVTVVEYALRARFQQ